MKRTSIGYFALLALSLLLPGCIKENLADCNFNISVEFVEKSNCGTDLSYPEIGNITVFAFNESGLFVDQFSDDKAVLGSSYKLPLSLPLGKYTLIAWTGVTSSQFKTLALIKGQTTLSELYMPSYQIRNGVKEAVFQPLFTGSINHVNAIEGVTQSIKLNATAKPLAITLSGGMDNHNYQISISSNAIRYKFENSLISLLTDNQYTMASLTADSVSASKYSTKTSLLWPMDNYTPQLTIRDVTTGTDIISANIKDMMAQLTQSNLDCEPLIKMEFELTQANSALVGVTINGWKVQYLNNEI